MGKVYKDIEIPNFKDKITEADLVLFSLAFNGNPEIAYIKKLDIIFQIDKTELNPTE